MSQDVSQWLFSEFQLFLRKYIGLWKEYRFDNIATVLIVNCSLIEFLRLYFRLFKSTSVLQMRRASYTGRVLLIILRGFLVHIYHFSFYEVYGKQVSRITGQLHNAMLILKNFFAHRF